MKTTITKAFSVIFFLLSFLFLLILIFDFHIILLAFFIVFGLIGLLFFLLSNKSTVKIDPFNPNVKVYIPDEKYSRIIDIDADGINGKVNLYELSCSCLDFRSNRYMYAKGDIRRHCKHLNKVIKYEKEIIEKMPPMIQSVIKDLWPVSQEFHFCSLFENNYYLFWFQSKAWINVFAQYSEKKPNQYRRFGFNPVEKRWAMDKKPLFQEKIVPIIKKTYKKYLEKKYNDTSSNNYNDEPDEENYNDDYDSDNYDKDSDEDRY